MRTLERNEKTLYYALYTSKAMVTDEDGNKTGEYEYTYGTPVAFLANISPNRGYASEEMFGIDTAYTKKIVTDDMACPIDEHTRIWIDEIPNTNATNWNYVVESVAKSLHSITYAVKEVKVS